MRLFIGIALSEEIKIELFQMQYRLKRYLKTSRFVPMENFHLTMKFFGECTEAEKDKIIQQLKGKDFVRPFSIELEDIGVFNGKKGKILWIGVKKKDHLISLYRKIEEELVKIDIPREKRDFRPHITLARNVEWKKDIQLNRVFPKEKVHSFVLYESVYHRNQVEYKELYRFTMK